MASKQIETVKVLYRSWTAAQAANPNMSLDEQRDMMESWAQLSAEPGGIDYIETEAGGVPAMWIVPKGTAQDLVWEYLDPLDVSDSPAVSQTKSKHSC